MPPASNIRLLSTWSEVSASLSAHWDEILQSTAYPGIFQTWDYVDAWFGQSGGAFTPHVLVALEGGKPVAVAPMALGSQMVAGRPWLRQLTFLGCGGFGLSEYLDFLIPEGRELELLPQILDSLKESANGQWDVLNFPLMPEDSLNTRMLDKLLPERFDVNMEPVEKEASPYVSLPERWEDFLGSKSASFRKAFNRKWNKLHREHKVKLLEAGVDMSVEEGIEHIIHLHNQRWGAESQAFSGEQFSAFHRELAPRLHAAGNVSLILLEVDGEVAAGRYDFAYNGVLWNYQGGWLPKYEKLSLGLVMLAHSIQWAINHGLEQYDFLIGESAYKSSWSSDQRSLVSIEAFRRGSLRAKLYRALRGVKRRMRK